MESEILELWETPFSAAVFPSVQVITDDEVCNSVNLIIASGGYPHYLIKFAEIYGFKVMDESWAPVNRFVTVQRTAKGCAYLWRGSLWLKEFLSERPSLEGEVAHYVLLGGDLIVEVLSKYEPKIEEFESVAKISKHYSV
jgi:hypothetical protein